MYDVIYLFIYYKMLLLKMFVILFTDSFCNFLVYYAANIWCVQF